MVFAVTLRAPAEYKLLDAASMLVQLQRAHVSNADRS
jgi:hypothetical protein